VVALNDKEVNVNLLLQQGFALAPSGVEVGKTYNPVFDRGQVGAKEQRDLGRDTRTSITSQVLQDKLGVVWL